MTWISSHSHWPAVEKLKKWPWMAKLFIMATFLPVGWPASAQLPVSRRTVRRRPISMTSPATPLISTQSPTRIPLRPMKNEPAEKGNDEILQGNRQSGAGQTENGGELIGNAEDHQQNKSEANGTQGEAHDDAQGAKTSLFWVEVA